jgi:hypothetical protein
MSDDLDRMLARADIRPLQRARWEAGATAQRLDQRSAGPQLASGPGELTVVARASSETPGVSRADLTNEIARQIAELSQLAGERGLLRAPSEISRQQEAAEPPPADEDEGEARVLHQWMEDLRERGLKEDEIEEQVVRRLRGLRRMMKAQSQIRAVGKSRFR